MEDNSISFPEADKYATFPEDAPDDASEEEKSRPLPEAAEKYATYFEEDEESGEAGLESTTLSPLVSRGWRDADLPRVGRQERSLTCVHVNGTHLSLR